MENYEQLLIQIKAINNRYAEVFKKTGGYFNIFTVLDIETNEVNMHCRLLYEFLNPNGSHCQGDKYLRLFVENVLKISNFDFRTAKVKREYIFDSGDSRIDFLIENKDYSIPIEVKIYANDQKEQLRRYFEYAKSKGEKVVYYLTLYGTEASECSVRRLNTKKDVINISFKKDIIEWLNECLRLDETIKIAVLRETIIHYISLLKKLTNQIEEGMELEIKNFISMSSENFKSALNISSTMETVKVEIMNRFFREIEMFMEKEFPIYRLINKDEYTKCTDKFYSQKGSSYPSLMYDLGIIDGCHHLLYRVEIDYNLFHGFSVGKILDNNEFQLDTKEYEVDFLSRFIYLSEEDKKIYEAAGWLWWGYLPYDKQSEVINFKVLNDLYISLYDESAFQNIICDIYEAIKGTLSEKVILR